MWTLLLDPSLQPFVIAAGVLVGLVAIEGIGTLAGLSAASALDHALGLHADTPGLHGVPPGPHAEAGHSAPRFGLGADAGLGWLNAGRLPLMVVLIALLGAFAASGFMLTALAHGLAFAPPPWAVAGAALVIALPATRWVGRAFARLMPRDETYVLAPNGLVGRTGLVVVGPVRDGVTARGRFEDANGNLHFPGLVPARPDLVIAQDTAIVAIADRDGVLAVLPAVERSQAPDR